MSDDTDPIYTLLTSMYNAGTNQDSYNRDKLIQDSTLILPKECKRYNLNSESGIDFNRIDQRALTDDTNTLFRYYQNNIEFVNSFSEQALEDERKYFTKKYSVKAYNNLLAQREAYFKQRKIDDAKLTTGPCEPVSCVDTHTNTNTIETTVLSNLKKNMTMWLLGENTDPKTTYRKIEYRSAEQATLSTLNQYVTFTYYIALGVLLLLLGTSGNLYFQERFLTYLLLLLLPVLYPFVFSWVYRSLSSWMKPDPMHGPKNAFLETKTDSPNAYDI
jgi:hypothetical protein